MTIPHLTILAGSLALALLTGAQKPAAAPPAGRLEHVADLGLALTLPEALGPLQDVERKDQVRAGWAGKLGPSAFAIRVYALPASEFGFAEPEDVTELVLDNIREKADPSFAFDTVELVSGAYGYTPYASLAHGAVHAKDGQKVTGGLYMLGGLAERFGYSIEVEVQPPLEAAHEKTVLDFLRKGVAYEGATRNPKWTDEEVKARWAKDAPAGLEKKLEKPVRTKHYIFLSNTDAAKQMGDEMEKSYVEIQKMYPFPEVAGRRLMPVFLFANQTQYYAFFAKQFQTTVEEASTSKGVAYHDFYATYYDAPQDPVHIHEMTHQIFANRLGLGGGGSWFQEGVAEYISTKASERTDAANLVKKERHVKLAELIGMRSLLSVGASDRKEGGKAGSLYLQAAMLIEFVRESKWSKDKFQDWVHAIGKCPDGNLAAIERATHAVLGVDLAGFEGKYVEYCKKR